MMIWIRCNKGIFTPSNKRKVKELLDKELKQEALGILHSELMLQRKLWREPITSIGEGFGKYTVMNKELSRSNTVGPP